MKSILLVIIVIALGLVGFVAYKELTKTHMVTEGMVCPMDAMICPDGSSVGREGPNCEFAACPEVTPSQNDIVAAHIASKSDLIRLTSPIPYEIIETPVTIEGTARGYWFFEASFPVELQDANGAVIATGPATAVGDWMTTEFVPFTANLTFTAPTTATGTLVLKKDNPSGLPENDDELRIPVEFEGSSAVLNLEVQ